MNLPHPLPRCMVCGRVCSPRTYMPMPWEPEQVHLQLREKKFMEITFDHPETEKPIRKRKTMRDRDGGPVSGTGSLF